MIEDFIDEEVLYVMRKAVGKTIIPTDNVQNELDALKLNMYMRNEGDVYDVK